MTYILAHDLLRLQANLATNVVSHECEACRHSWLYGSVDIDRVRLHTLVSVHKAFDKHCFHICRPQGLCELHTHQLSLLRDQQEYSLKFFLTRDQQYWKLKFGESCFNPEELKQKRVVKLHQKYIGLRYGMSFLEPAGLLLIMGLLTSWIVKSFLAPLKYVLGGWTRSGTTSVYIKKKNKKCKSDHGTWGP